MANDKEIRGRIASVKNTRQITKAMKMVSAAKLRKAQDNITNLRPYAKGLLQVIADIAATQRVKHDLLEPVQNPKKVLMVVLTSDRGLCGAFNSSAYKSAEKYYNENKDKYETLDFFFIGKKASEYFSRRGLKGVDSILNMAKDISYEMAAGIAKRLIESFTQGEYDEIRMVYNEFKSAISQELVSETLLPVDVSTATVNSDGVGFSNDLIFEPAPEEMIDELLEKHFAVHVYRCMSESVAGEHAARMASMDNATNNATEMIDKLTLTYNKLRQASITTELTEITSGAEALKG